MLKYTLSLLLTVAMLSTGMHFLAKEVIRSGDALERSWQILEPHPVTLWRNRPGLSTTFYGHEVVTDSYGLRTSLSLARAEVLVLGPSSSFGWGVDGQATYASSLTLPTINAGQVGFSMEQGELFLRDLLNHQSLKPRFLIVAFGVNDLDRFRFYFPSLDDDARRLAEPPSSLSVQLAKLGNWLLFPPLLSKRLAHFAAKSCPPLPKGQRASLAQTIAALERIHQLARSAGSQLIVMNTAHRFEGRVDASWDMKAQHFAGSYERLSCKDKVSAFPRAMEVEKTRLSTLIAALNRELAAWSQRHGVTFVDIESLGLDARNFVDPVHFSPQGHRQVALRLNQILAELR